MAIYHSALSHSPLLHECYNSNIINNFDDGCCILGIDPGLCTTGWAVLNINPFTIGDRGVFVTKSTDELSHRIQYLHSEISQLIRYTRAKHVALEAGYCGIDGFSALKLGMVRGAIVVACNGLELQMYAPAYIKKEITSKGNASKAEMLSAVNDRFPGLQIKKHDIADAIAVAVCAYNALQQGK